MITNYYKHDLLFLYKKTISIFKSHGIQSKSIKVAGKNNILYCRVSSAKQKHDLETHIEELQITNPDYHVISDVCSGINFKRSRLRFLTGQMLPRIGQRSYYHAQRGICVIWIRLVRIIV